MYTWQLQKAKEKLTELIKRAHDNPQFITRHGKAEVVVLSIKKFQELTQPKKSIVSFFKESPLFGITLNIQRDKSLGRKIKLEVLT